MSGLIERGVFKYNAALNMIIVVTSKVERQTIGPCNKIHTEMWR